MSDALDGTIRQVAEPALLDADGAQGLLHGSSERYVKYLADLEGLYRDSDAYESALAADDGSPAYWVESSTVERGDGALTIGVSTLRPGNVGDEYSMTRGHLHGRPEFAELYFGLRGTGVMLLESVEGDSRALPVRPGIAVHVPGGWIHRSINTGEEDLVTLFCYGTEAGQDYEIIRRAGGMKQLVIATADGWDTRLNPDHEGYRA